MTKPTFDLVCEAWIPVVGPDGETEEVGLRDALVSAHERRVLRDPLPTVEFGLHRLLCALVLDIFSPPNVKSLDKLMGRDCFDPNMVDAYLAQWHDRFDLFSKPYPFLQTAGMDSDPDKPLAGLLHPMPSGTNAAHFHHAHEDDFGVSPAAAARLLTTLAPFMTAGGAGLAPSINGAPPWYVLLRGGNLFETLCLNSAVPPFAPPGEGPPAWRDDRPVLKDRSKGASLLEGLTWRPRRIALVPGVAGVCSLMGQESPVLVRAMKFGPGASCDFVWHDPAVPYKTDEKGPKVMRPQEGRDVWRDTGPLGLLQEADFGKDEPIRFRRPALIDQFARLSSGSRARPLSLALYGLRTDMKMKVFEWRREELSLPMPLVLHTFFHRAVQDAMAQAGSVDYALKSAIKMVYPREGKGSKAAFDALVAGAQRDFWAALRPHYDHLLEELALLSPEDRNAVLATRGAWQQHLKRIGQQALTDAIGDLDTDADALERLTKAEQLFRKRVFTLFEPAAPKATRISPRTSSQPAF